MSPAVRWGASSRRSIRVEADMVIAVPTTGHSAAQGYSEVSGIPYGDGLYKNHYVGRTFIQPSQSLRDRGVKLKLNPLPDSIRGKRLIVVDDSIVRGTTTKQIVLALREAGATEVHIRITCPPLQWPCFYGIDMPTRQELIGADLTVDEIRAYVGADSLGYLSLDGMVEAAGGCQGVRSAGRASTASTRSRCPSRRASSCWRTSCGCPPGDRPRGDAVTDAYRRAGVDIEAAAKAVTLIGDLAARARRPEVADEVGGFAGLFRIGDGAAARGCHRRRRHEARDRARDGPPRHRRHRSRGDVRRRRRVHRRRAAVLPRLPRRRHGRARAGRRRSSKAWPKGAAGPDARCSAARPPSIPGTMPDDQFDLAGFCVGSSTRQSLLGPHRVREGDVLIGLASSGLHANGYSLVRHALLARHSPRRHAAGARRPHRSPTSCSSRARSTRPACCPSPATASCTLPRTSPAVASTRTCRGRCPPGLGAEVERGAWPEPPIFSLVQACSRCDRRRHVLYVQHGHRHGARGRPRRCEQGARPQG